MASAAGQVWVLVVLRLEHSVGGDNYPLCMVDVFSRYAIVERLTAATSLNVQLAFKDRVLTLCSPELIITDGGSEFKAHFRDTRTALNLRHHVTTPHHSEGHGIVERFNCSFTRTLSHMLKSEQKENWHLHMAPALIA